MERMLIAILFVILEIGKILNIHINQSKNKEINRYTLT